MRAHTDKEIIEQASKMEKRPEEIIENKINITLDIDDENGTAHTYVVSFGRDLQGIWNPLDVSEVSSL